MLWKNYISNMSFQVTILRFCNGCALYNTSQNKTRFAKTIHLKYSFASKTVSRIRYWGYIGTVFLDHKNKISRFCTKRWAYENSVKIQDLLLAKNTQCTENKMDLHIAVGLPTSTILVLQTVNNESIRLEIRSLTSFFNVSNWSRTTTEWFRNLFEVYQVFSIPESESVCRRILYKIRLIAILPFHVFQSRICTLKLKIFNIIYKRGVPADIKKNPKSR